MQIDPTDISPSEFYQHMIRVIVPRPIAWVSTQSRDGIDNLAPFSYFSGVGARPPSILFCPANRRDGTRKDTLVNIESTGEFVVNLVPFQLAEAMFTTSAEIDSSESEFSASGMTPAKSFRVKPPRVAESPVQIECSLLQTIHLAAGPGGANIVIGRVLHLHLDDSVLDSHGFADPAQLDAVGRMGGTGYCRTSDRFNLPANP